MIVYIDKDYKCYTTPADGMIPVEVPFFDDKCTTLIEGYRFVPTGESWTREDGEVFQGEMIAPWQPFDELDVAQREYERQQMADMENALAILLGGETV